MGGYLSGWHGRRSSRPFFDELLRITIVDCKQYPPGLILLPWQGGYVTVRKIIVPSGFLAVAARLQCASCGRACKVLYLHRAACCYRCAGARYRTQSESPSRRAYRTALKTLRRAKIEPGRKKWKPKWMRWPTYCRLTAEAEAVFPIVVRAENAPYALLAKLDAPKRKRGRPPKTV